MNILLELRKSQGMTQMDVVHMVRERGVVKLSETHYRRLEKGQCLPSVLLAMELAAVLDSDVYEIWG
jgi:DNA-binding XRE family transcriptional regulator